MSITDAQFLDIYLRAQQEPPSPPGTPPGLRHVSTFWAGLSDARGTAGRDLYTGVVQTPKQSASWLAAVGYLCWFDQVGGALVLDSKPNVGSAFLGGLERFSDLSEAEREALYGLRNSLAHDYSLINPKTAQNARFPLRWHCFALDPHAHPIQFPAKPWDGLTYPPTQTSVGLRWVGDLAELVKDRVLAFAGQGRVSPTYPADQALPRFTMQYAA